MENEYFFLNAGIAPLLHLESSNPIPNWQQQQQSQMELKLNSSSDGSPDQCFCNNPSWEKSTDQQSMQFDSALSSMVSSPVASNSNISNDSFVIRELIGKLGNIGNNNNVKNGSSGEISLANTSCYSTPLNSPPKMMNCNLGRKPLSLNSSVAEFAADPGFAERAARFSCFGSRSFNGRTTQFGFNNSNEFNNNTNNNNIPGGSNSSPLAGNGNKLSRVSSSPALKALGSQLNSNNSQEESTVSEQNPNGEKALKPEMNSRKRKAASKGKILPSSSPPTTKVITLLAVFGFSFLTTFVTKI